MPDDPPNPSPAPTGEPAAPQEQQPPYVIEGARSSRSKCKTCRKKIDKDVLRLGVLIEGPYGIGYLWHHLTCAAKRRLDDVEESYAAEAWKQAKIPPESVPPIEELRKLHEEAEEKRQSRQRIPYAEVDPSGRAKCKECGELMEKGSLRVVLGREVEFGNQFRTMPIQVHPACVAVALEREDCSTEAGGFASEIRMNSQGLDSEQIASVLEVVGELPEEEAPPF
jgi:Poly(ADP-ribose) polymerase and DNA-Ligase Zn-finger region